MSIELTSQLTLGGVKLPEVKLPYNYYVAGGLKYACLYYDVRDSSNAGADSEQLITFEMDGDGWIWGRSGPDGEDPTRWSKVGKTTPNAILKILALRNLGVE